MKKRIGVQGFLIFLANIALIFFYRYLFALDRPRILDSFLTIFGMTLILFGFALRICARGFKAQENRDGKTLVTTGPYALTRNPMYFGTLLIGMGIISVLFRWWVALVLLFVYLAIYIPQINREEESLSAHFPKEFPEYCRKVPKFFPRWSVLLSLKEYAWMKQGWIKKELSSLILTLVFTIGLKLWISIF